jgi:uncharacterized protein YjcR
MTPEQKRSVLELALKGLSYSRIAEKLEISVNTVKSYCRRKKKKGNLTHDPNHCRNCGKRLWQNPKHKPKVFCSESCRRAWWNKHQSVQGRKSTKQFHCACCGQSFNGYNKHHRKYCSHACYIKYRYGGTP